MKSTSANGQLYICNSCKKFHLEFGNIGMDFNTPEKLSELSKYLKTVHSNHFENESTTSVSRRKILIPFTNSTTKLLLSDAEILELMKLIRGFLDKLHQTNENLTRLCQLDTITYLNSIILN